MPSVKKVRAMPVYNGYRFKMDTALLKGGAQALWQKVRSAFAAQAARYLFVPFEYFGQYVRAGFCGAVGRRAFIRGLYACIAGGRGVFCVFYAFVFRAGAAGFAQRLKKIEKGEFIRAYALLLSNFH